jgi:PKD repeat protein
MKFIRNIFISLALLVTPALKSQCSGDYTWLENGLTLSFFSTISPGVNYIIWDFGDGAFDYSNAPYTQHTYANPGTYQVCIQYYDTTNFANCADSTCHFIVLDTCYGSFSYTVSGLTVIFDGESHGGGPNTNYAWNFGDNSPGSSVEDPTYTYSAPGNYTVCFAFYDLSTGCSDSVCYPISIGSACTADFTWIDTLGTTFFINASTPGSSGSYIWDFGDGNYSYQENPSNVYAAPGVYIVCLIAYDSNQVFCDSTCQVVTVAGGTGTYEFANPRNMQVSPNPADGEISIQWMQSQQGPVTISLYDISGRYITTLDQQHYSAGQQFQKLNTGNLASGSYMLQLNSMGQNSLVRIVVTHGQ